MKKHLNRLTCLFLLLLFGYSLLALIISCLGLSVQPSFYLWVALLCVSTWYTTCTRNGLFIGLPASALLLFAASRFFSADLVPQLNDAIDRLTGAYVEQVVSPGAAYTYLNGASDHSLLLLFLVFLLSSYMGASVSSRSSRIGLALLGSVPFCITCLAVSIRPPILPVFGLILFWFLLAVSGSHYDEEAESYRRVCGSFLPLCLLLSLLLSYVKPNEYEYDPSTSSVSRAVEKLFRNLDERMNGFLQGEPFPGTNDDPSGLDSPNEEASSQQDDRAIMPWQDGQGGLDLTRTPDPAQWERIYLRVRAEQNGTLYLRAVSYGEYRGTSWSSAEEDAPVTSLSFTAKAVSAAGVPHHTVSVQSIQESIYRCLPYFCAEEKDFDSFVPAGYLNRYSVRYSGFPSSFIGLSVPAVLSEKEQEYRAYAHEFYTRLPEATRLALQEICAENGLSPDMADPITQVASFVQQTAQYELNPGAYPGDDYAVSFLTTVRRGCCVHFATAAAALYRCLGIPARVTEGFLLDGKADETVDVKGSQAHAWVEVYQDGLGWLPVEVTGQSGLDSDALGSHDTAPSPEPNPDGESPASDPQNSLSAPSSLPVGLLNEANSASASSDFGKAVWRSLGWILAAAALIAILPLRRRLLLLLRSRSFEQDDTRKAVIALYRTSQKAARYGSDTPPMLLHTAERAAFSQHEISPDEVERCRDQLFMQLKSAYWKQKSWGKFRFKYFDALL